MSLDAQYQRVMADLVDAQTRGHLGGVYNELLSLAAEDFGPAQSLEIQIALGAIEDDLGLTEEAQARLELARAKHAETASPDQAQRLGYYLVMSYLRTRRWREAESALAFYAPLVPQTASHRSLYKYCEGTLREGQGRLAEAESAFRQSHRLAEAAGRLTGVMSALAGLARIHLIRGEFALARLALAEHADRERSYEYDTIHCDSLIAMALAGEGDHEALESARKTWNDARSAQLPNVAAWMAILSALLEHHGGRDEKAAEWLARAATDSPAEPVLPEIVKRIDAWMRGEAIADGGHVEVRALAAVLEGGVPESPTAFSSVAAAILTRNAAWKLDVDRHVLESTEGERHDLQRRGPLRRIVEFLATSNAPVSTGELFEAGWPGVTAPGPNGYRRVYTEIDRLRKLGLEIVSTDEGYLLETSVRVTSTGGVSNPR